MGFPKIVTVTDPKHPDSNHEHSFVGTLIGTRDSIYSVRDGDGNVWDVSENEIEESDRRINVGRITGIPFNWQKITPPVRDNAELASQGRRVLIDLSQSYRFINFDIQPKGRVYVTDQTKGIPYLDDVWVIGVEV